MKTASTPRAWSRDWTDAGHTVEEYDYRVRGRPLRVAVARARRAGLTGAQVKAVPGPEGYELHLRTEAIGDLDDVVARHRPHLERRLHAGALAKASTVPSSMRVRWRSLAVSRRPALPVGPPPSPNRDPYPFTGSLIYQGIPILVEQRKGETRSGTAKDGTRWSVTMAAHYGEFADTLGTDGDAVDVYVGPVPDAPYAYVVHQKVPGTEVHDEDKVILGVNTAAEAEALYRAHYDRPGFWGGLTRWPLAELRQALLDHRYHGKRLDTPAWVRERLEKALALGLEALAKCGCAMIDAPRPLPEPTTALIPRAQDVAPAPATDPRQRLAEALRGVLLAAVTRRALQAPLTLHQDDLLVLPGLHEVLLRAAYAAAQIEGLGEQAAALRETLQARGPVAALAKAQELGLLPGADGRASLLEKVAGQQLGLFGRAPSPPPAPAPAPAPNPVRLNPDPPPAAFTPIPGSRRGGYHQRKADGSYSYWYPGEGKRAQPHLDDADPPAQARLEPTEEHRALAARLIDVEAAEAHHKAWSAHLLAIHGRLVELDHRLAYDRFNRRAAERELDEIEALAPPPLHDPPVEHGGLLWHSLAASLDLRGREVIREAVKWRREVIRNWSSAEKAGLGAYLRTSGGGLNFHPQDQVFRVGPNFRYYQEDVERKRSKYVAEQHDKVYRETVDMLARSFADLAGLPHAHRALLRSAGAKGELHIAQLDRAATYQWGYAGRAITDGAQREAPRILLFDQSLAREARGIAEQGTTLVHEVAHVVDRLLQVRLNGRAPSDYFKADLGEHVLARASQRTTEHDRTVQGFAWARDPAEVFAEGYRYAYRDGDEMTTAVQARDFDPAAFRRWIDGRVELALQQPPPPPRTPTPPDLRKGRVLRYVARLLGLGLARELAKARRARFSGPSGEQLSLFGRTPAPVEVHQGPKPPPGFTPIAGSKHGGYHKLQADGTYLYWYPDQPDQHEHPGRPEDRTLVEHGGQPLVELVSPTGERRQIHEFQFASDDSDELRILHYSDEQHIGPGTTFRGANGRLWTVQQHNPKDGALTATANDGSTYEGPLYRFHSQQMNEHKATVDALRAQRRERLIAEGKAALDTLPERIAEVLADPTEPTLVAAHALLTRTRRQLAYVGFRSQQDLRDVLARKLGVSQDLPESWKSLAEEVTALRERLLPRLPGRLLPEATHDPEDALRLGLDPQLMRDALRWHILSDAARAYAYEDGLRRAEKDNKGRVYIVPVADLIRRLPEQAPEGGYTPEQAQAALQDWMKNWLGRKARPNELRRIVIGHRGLYIGHDTETTERNLSAIGAIDRFCAQSGGRVLHLTRYQPKDDGLYDYTAANRWSRALNEGIREVGRAAGAEPSPEILDESKPPPELTPAAVLEAVAKLNDDYHGDGKALVARNFAEDKVVALDLATGKRDERYGWPEREAVLLPLSLGLRTQQAEMTRNVARWRTEHRARMDTLRGHLDAVQAKLGDVKTMAAEELRAAAVAEGIDPALLDQVEPPRFAKDGLFHRAYELWGLAHPERKAVVDNHEDAPERRKASDERWEFAKRVSRAAGRGMHARMRAALGHETDLDAARAAVLARPEPTPEQNVKPHDPYDVQADPDRLGDLWGFLSKNMIPHVSVVRQHDRVRAYCGYDNVIVLAHNDGPRVLWHEYGHAIEHDHPEVKTFANTLRDERGRGEKLQKLREIHHDGYEDHEVTYKDEWAHPYSGKWYQHMGSTEVLSMGTEELIGDPFRFYNEDPQHFLFTVAALSGQLGTTKKPVHPTVRSKA